MAPLIKETGCHGLCSEGTLVNLAPADLLYVRVQPQDVPEIVEASLAKKGVVERLLYQENGDPGVGMCQSWRSWRLCGYNKARQRRGDRWPSASFCGKKC